MAVFETSVCIVRSYVHMSLVKCIAAEEILLACVVSVLSHEHPKSTGVNFTR
jgi:hypothetical protein